MKILKIYNDWTQTEERKKTNGYGGCGYYRTIKIAEVLKEKHEVDVWGNEWQEEFEGSGKKEELFFHNIGWKYDLVWMHYVDNPKLFSWLKVACEQYDTKLVMDIDDNFLDLHESNPANKLMGKGSVARNNLATILSLCDAVTVSTLPLKERLAKHFLDTHGIKQKIYVVPNCNDIKDWEYEPVKNTNGIVVGYMGSVSHHDDLALVLPAIKKIMEKYPKVGFQLLGQLTFDQAKDVFKNWKQSLRKRIVMVRPTGNFQDFPEYFSAQGWDIGIAPLIDSPFNRSKSHIKWMEYSMYKIPTVASRVYPYYKDIYGVDTIIDGVNGLLCEPDEWEKKLSLLIENKELRKKLGENAYNFVKDKWQYSQWKEKILEVTEKLV